MRQSLDVTAWQGVDVLDDATTVRLGDALRAAGFTVDACQDHLGDVGQRALGRNHVVPAERATRGGSPLETLVRLFTLQVPVERAAADAALPGLVEPLAAAGFLEVAGGEIRARIDVRPYGDETHDWFVVCDPTPGLGRTIEPMDPQYVLGISEASSSLAHLVIRDRVGRALDLGTGCGVQTLHLAQHAHDVVATDVNPRALAMARLTARLNDLTIDVRDGSLFDPVADETFDLIATNPPFVISPPGSPVLVYRDSGMPGDAVVRHVVEQAADHLNPRGWCQILANWAIRRDRDWRDDLAGWVDGRPLDAWVLQREQLDPAEYVEMWLSDAGVEPGAEHTRRYDEWLGWFDAEGIVGLAFGWLSFRHTDAVPTTRFETWTGPVAAPVGPDVAAWGRAVDLLRRLADRELLDLTLLATPMAQETIGPVGAADPERITLHRRDGIQRARRVDTVEAGFVSACDGDLTVGQILGALAQLLDRPDLVETHLDRVKDLLLEGFLAPSQGVLRNSAWSRGR